VMNLNSTTDELHRTGKFFNHRQVKKGNKFKTKLLMKTRGNDTVLDYHHSNQSCTVKYNGNRIWNVNGSEGVKRTSLHSLK